MIKNSLLHTLQFYSRKIQVINYILQCEASMPAVTVASMDNPNTATEFYSLYDHFHLYRYLLFDLTLVTVLATL